MRYPIRATLPGLMPFAVVLFLSSFCSAQQVTIRVVNSGDRQPLPGWKVDVYYVNQTEGNGALQGSQHLQTDADGAVQFTLPQSVPDVLTVDAFPQVKEQVEKWYPCSVRAETAVVVQKGIQSKPCAAGITAHGKVRANPGQILILAERVTLWDRIWRTILGPLVRG
jgi:hypothetical protein